MGTLGFSIDDPENIHVAFALAYVMISIGFVFAIGCWVTSEHINLLRKKARFAKPKKKKEARRRYLVRMNGGLIAIGFCFLVFMHYGIKIEAAKRLSTFSGTLVAANDPFIPACNGASGDEAIILVGTAAYKFARWPATLLSVKGQKRIVLDRDQNSRITFTADVFSSDGKILASLLKNTFNVNKNNIFRIERPDDSTLKVIDQWNETALLIRYLNLRQLRFDAKLYYPGVGYIDIFDRIQSLCIDLGQSGAALFGVN